MFFQSDTTRTKNQEVLNMTLHFHATGAERKRLAHAIGELIGEKPVYQFMPTCAYQIGSYVLDR